MRKVKFRGYSKESNEWVYGSLINNMFFESKTGDPILYIIDTEDAAYDSFEDMDCLVQKIEKGSAGEYTGLKDNNGQEIYEGDIIRANSMKSHKLFEVIYGRCSFEFIRETGGIYRADQLSFSDVEVVNNIFKTGKSRKLDILYQDRDGRDPHLPF